MSFNAERRTPNAEPGAIPMTSLQVNNLTVQRGACPVVDDVSFTAAVGQVTALVGPNGAGKSTVIKAMLGLVPKVQGAITWEKQELTGLDPRRRARLVAYVPQHSRLVAGMSVVNVVAMGRYAHQGGLARLSATDREAVDLALGQVDARHLIGRRFDELSCGESHCVLLARALATGARLILLDEPTASLDIGHALAVLDLLRRLAAEGRAVLAVLHHLEEVRHAADRAVLLHRGRILVSGGVDAVLAPEPLMQAFGVMPVPGGALGFRRENAAHHGGTEARRIESPRGKGGES